ncbi:MAG: ExbD/TolR family protein [Pseudomonadales bacterium]
MARKAEENDGAIDLTPMLDVVFIMLIFFIVTASFVKEAGIQVIKPEGTTATDRNAKILIAISGNDEVWIDKNPVDKRSVKNHIERLRSENPKGGVVLQADMGATAEMVAHVLDMAREAGAIDVALSTERN